MTRPLPRAPAPPSLLGPPPVCPMVLNPPGPPYRSTLPPIHTRHMTGMVNRHQSTRGRAPRRGGRDSSATVALRRSPAAARRRARRTADSVWCSAAPRLLAWQPGLLPEPPGTAPRLPHPDAHLRSAGPPPALSAALHWQCPRRATRVLPAQPWIGL